MKQNRQQEILALIEREVRRAERDTLQLVAEMISARIDARDKLLSNPEGFQLRNIMKHERFLYYKDVRMRLRHKNIEDCEIIGKIWDIIEDLRERKDENK